MRSRYTAYALALVRYIQRTQADDKADLRELASMCRANRWQGLELLEHNTDHATGEGVVEFVAYFSQGASPDLQQHHERSRFRRSGAQWIYLDFIAPIHAAPEKPELRMHVPPPQRNSSCPCGSGRKYKQCCGKL